MKNQKLIIWLIVGAVAAAGIGFYMYSKEQVKLLKSYCYKLKDIKIVNATINKLKFDVSLAFKNQSDMEFDLVNYAIDVFAEGVKLTTINSKITQTVAGKSVTDIKFSVDIVPSEVFSDNKKLGSLITKAITNRNSIIIGIDGKITAAYKGIKLKGVPVKMEMTVGDMLSDDDTLYKCTI